MGLFEELQRNLVPLLKEAGLDAHAVQPVLGGPVVFYRGSAGGQITVANFFDDDAVRIRIPILDGSAPEPRLLAMNNEVYPAGHVYLHYQNDGTVNVGIAQFLLLTCGYRAIARTAQLMILWVDGIDDELQAAYGGRRNTDPR